MAEGVNLNLSLDKSILDRELKGENANSEIEGDGNESENEVDSQGRPSSIREIKMPDPSFIKDESKHDSSVGNQTINSGFNEF